MKNNILSKKAFTYASFVFALVMLFNPNINILDPLPDFIGQLIIAKLLLDAARRVPFFEEARVGFLKLALISFAKYPAFILMVMIRGANTSDNDVITLFSFSFAIIEGITLVGAVRSLFDGISYLGARTGATSIIGKNPTSDSLRTFTLVFSVMKCALYALPEFLLLSTTVDAGSPTTMMPEARFYPVALAASQLIGYAVGLAWIAFFMRYLRAIKESGEFYPAIASLTNTEKEAEIAYKIKKDKVLSGLKFLPVAVLLSFDFTLDTFNGTNILPHFISGFLLLFVFSKLITKKGAIGLAFKITTLLYSLFAFVVWMYGIDYHDNFTHVELALYEKADKMFTTYALLSLAEALLFTAVLVLAFLLLVNLVLTHTGKTPPRIHDPLAKGTHKGAYTAHDKRYHVSLIIKSGICFLIGLALALSRFVYVFTNNERAFDHGSLIPKVAPWLGTAIFAISLLWFVYSLYFTGLLAEDFKIKYSDSHIDEEPKESQYF